MGQHKHQQQLISNIKETALSSDGWKKFTGVKTTIPTPEDIRQWPTSIPLTKWPKNQLRQYKNILKAVQKSTAEENGTLHKIQKSERAKNLKRTKANMDPEKWKVQSKKKYERNKKFLKKQKMKLSVVLAHMRTKSTKFHGEDLITVTEIEGGRHIYHDCGEESCLARCNCSHNDMPDCKTECYLCGAENATSPDAVIPSLGHVTGNIRSACINCQYFKKDTTPDEFKAYAEALVSHAQRGRPSTKVTIPEKKMGKKWSNYRYSSLSKKKNKFGQKTLDVNDVGMQYEHEDGSKTKYLTRSDMLELFQTSCFWCGEIPSVKKIGGADRLNNNLPYIQGNVVPSCSRCNYAKAMPRCVRKVEPSPIELIAHLTKVLQFQTPTTSNEN
jgi:hypothetical protein